MANSESARRRAKPQQPAAGESLEDLRLLSVFEAAEILGVSPWSVRRLITTGALKSRRILDRVLISRGDLAELITRSLVA